MSLDADNFRKIINELKDYIYRNHKLPSVSDIAEIIGISDSKCKDLCDVLEGQKQIYKISGGGKGKPIIIIPYYMMEMIFNTQPRPDWIREEKYNFKEIENLSKQEKKISEKMNFFYNLQRLLYGTDIPLQISVTYALKYLEFNDVVHHEDNTNYADVTFKNDDIKYLIEVEGTTKQGNKEKVLQLDGWIEVDINDGLPADRLRGMFILNHKRDDSPAERGDPLTYHAKQFMKRYNFILLTTPFLFEIIKQVHYGEISSSDARNLILKGENIDD